jgi:hypothetical protein
MVIAGLALALVGCSSSSGGAAPNHPWGPLPASSPLTTCVDPAPAKVKPVDPGIAGHFADRRITHTLSLDDGTFRADPPHKAVPKIGAAQAYCNLLAGVDASNRGVMDSARAHGVSFGLGVVTVDGSLKSDGVGFVAIGPDNQPVSAPKAHLMPYAKRLAWIAVFKPDVVASCPVGIVQDGKAPPTTKPRKPLTAFQVLAIDANTGANGILYATRASNLCGDPGTRPPSYAPAKIAVSVPWTLSSRGTDPTRATIDYQARPCDDRSMVIDGASGKPAVSTDRDHPGVVRVWLERTLTTCGPAVKVPVMLRGEYPDDVLPQHLVHGPVGALDLPEP